MEKMTKETLEEKLTALEKKYEAEKRAIQKEYAFSNNTLKVGDNVTDHNGTIKIEKIGLYLHYSSSPSCYYEGIELKKDGTPKKGEPKRNVFQVNMGR